jgi:pimeloyl-ACP methyl ester carboxylesterase
VPYLARHFRVITVEGRGNGRADRPGTEEAYSDQNYVDDAIAALDATGVDRAVVIGSSLGARHALQLAAWYPVVVRAGRVVPAAPAATARTAVSCPGRPSGPRRPRHRGPSPRPRSSANRVLPMPASPAHNTRRKAAVPSSGSATTTE